MERAAIILAAGKGTRMKSAVPKVLHKVGGQAMIDWSIALAHNVGCRSIIPVIAPDADGLRAHLTDVLGAKQIATQSPALGTGHAVQSTAAALATFKGYIVVLYADSPLIPVEAVEALFQSLDDGADIAVLGFEAADPGQYGRLLLGADGNLEAIMEAGEASPEERAITFCNSGVLAVRAERLFALLAQVTNDNAKGEYYLTDIVGLSRAEGQRVVAVACAEDDVLGVNARTELAKAEAAFQAQARLKAMEEGATLIDPSSVYFAFDTVLSQDVVIEPGVIFGPGVTVGEGTQIRAYSYLEGVDVGSGCTIGPFARLRPGAELGPGVRIGNFVEVKNVRLGEGAKANHLAYLGDGTVGAGANIGAGTIFCNYDGFDKAQTSIGPGAFIGSNSALVAPVTIGQGAYVGSGSVVTKNVSEDALSVARARQRDIPGWAARFRGSKSADET